jgi:hypothetical protein
MVTEMKILGFDIDSKAEQLRPNFEKCISTAKCAKLSVTGPGSV